MPVVAIERLAASNTSSAKCSATTAPTCAAPAGSTIRPDRITGSDGCWTVGGSVSIATGSDVSGESAQSARGRGCPDVVPDVRETQTIGPGNAQSRSSAECANLPFEFKPRLDPAFRKAGRNNNRRPGAFFMTFAEHAKHFIVGNDDADQVRCFREVADALV